MIPNELRKVMKITLEPSGLWSQDAEDLLIGTGVHESDGLKRISQYGNGPALSYFQMEPATLNDLYANYLKFHLDKKKLLDELKIPRMNLEDNLLTNLPFAIMAARLQYYRVTGPIPSHLEGQAEYWKKWWNTVDGKGTTEQYIEHAKEFV